MMIMLMMALTFNVVMMLQPFVIGLSLVMGHRMHQHLQPRPLSCGYGNYRNTEHLRQTMDIQFHPPFFNNIHHIQRQNDRFPEFNEL